MGFLDKIASWINGTPPDRTETRDKTDISPSPKPKRGKEVNIEETRKEEKSILPGKDAPVTSEERKGEDIDTTSDIDMSRVEKPDNPKPGLAIDKSALYSDSLSEQRYWWHKYLLSILSSVETDNVDSLKYFTVYIRKNAGCKYQWNDEAFKRELLVALKPFDCASYMGSASFGIEVVSAKFFTQMVEKPVTDAQYLQQVEEVILFGNRKETTEQKFSTAIDKRAFVIKELLKKFRDSTGADSRLIENLLIIVVRDEDEDDMIKFDWTGKRFEDDLRRELTNAFLDNIGRKSLKVVLRSKSEAETGICLIENQVYYKWEKPETSSTTKPKDMPYERVLATLSLIEGTGSLVKSSYILDPDKKKVYHIGRGITSRKAGKYRVNDIVVKDNERDEELQQFNAHVSSAHADILFRNNKYYLKASVGGCRTTGGSPTKIVRDEKEIELRDPSLIYPLQSGDMIELGKKVLLIFSLSTEDDFDESEYDDLSNRE